jgi:ABC-type uncharacterized transport system ATPase subunit
MSQPSILLLHEVTVSFDGFRALNELSLDIEVGELRCIIGPNGAGKTTMMDVITGKTRADRGKVMFDQNIDVRRMTEPDIAHLGIGRKFQKPTIFENLTVFENLELSMKMDKRARVSLFAWLDDDANDKISDTLRLIRLDTEAGRQAGLLSHGQKQWLEIGMLLMQDPKLLLLDEPVAGAHRGAFQIAGRQALAGGGRTRHGLHRAARRQGHRAARRLGAGRRRPRHGAERPAGDRGLSGAMKSIDAKTQRRKEQQIQKKGFVLPLRLCVFAPKDFGIGSCSR